MEDLKSWEGARYHARMARRAQHLRCSLSERSERADNKLDKGARSVQDIKNLYKLQIQLIRCLRARMENPDLEINFTLNV